MATLQSAAQLLGIKFLDRLVLGLVDCEEGKEYLTVVESMNWQREGRA